MTNAPSDGPIASTNVLLLVGFALPMATRGYLDAWELGHLFVQTVLALMGSAGVHAAANHAPAKRARLVACYGYFVVGVVAIGLVLTSMQTMTPFVLFGGTSLAVFAGAPSSRWRRAVLALLLVPSAYWGRAAIVPWLPGGVVPAIFDAEPEDVVAIDIAPTSIGSMPLFTDPLTIGNRDTIAQIVSALDSAKPSAADHPHTNWRVVMALRYEDRLVKASVSHTNRGVLVYLDSPGGLRLAERRADALGDILEPLAKRQ